MARAPLRQLGFFALALALFLLLLLLLVPRAAWAEGPPKSDARGLAVLALTGAGDATWPLARAVYASTALRPAFDEAHARVLAGEAPASDAPGELRDLAETRAAIRGDDAPSRQLLLGVSRSLAVRGVVVVEMAPDGRASARVFVAEAGGFDAARYEPDEERTPAEPTAGARTIAWGATVRSLERAYGPAGAAPATSSTTVPGPSAAVHEGPRVEPPPRTPARKFYESPWFWGALGVAAFAGGAVYFATRDNSSGTIHLQMQVPR